MKDWYQYRPWNLTHRAQLRESGHMTYHTTALLPNSCVRRHYYQIPMADGPFRDPNWYQYRSVLSSRQILDPSMKDWYQYRPWNLTHRAQLRESGISPIESMTYNTTALLPNSCGPMADGPFRDPKGRYCPHPKYWTHRWTHRGLISISTMESHP